MTPIAWPALGGPFFGVRRVRERADKVREEMVARGVTIDPVELIRESREEL